MNIPIMHDDQHGTAIISSAALLNALVVSGKKIEKIILVVNGQEQQQFLVRNYTSHLV